MGFSAVGIWPVCIGLWGLLSALPVRGRGDTFHVEHTQAIDLAEASSPPDDILNINQVLILPEAPESSFLLEGDIIKASPFRLFSSANPRWPKKRGIVQIPYVLSYKYDNSSMKTIKAAFEDFARFTCIKFVPYSYQRDFISVVPLSGCFSNVGRIGGMQVVSLAPACLRKGKGVALHELMHVLGFWHEHSRADRDKYISISWNEILTGFEINFMKSWNSNMLVNYDYSSVMHYGRNAFSMTGLPTIIPLSSSYTVLGQRWYLSNSDIARVNMLYKCSQRAAQPEMSAERAVKENIRDFVPSETEPCSPASKVKASTAWNPSSAASASKMARPVRPTLGATMPSSRAVGKGISAIEAQTRRVWSSATEQRSHSLASPETPGKAGGSSPLIMATAEMARKTQSRETESERISNAAHETSVPQAWQNPSGSAREPPSDQAAYVPSRQISMEPGTRAAPELDLRSSFLTRIPVPFSAEMVQEVATRPGKKEAGAELSRTKSTHLEDGTDLSTAMEVGRSWASRTSKSEGENASLDLTEGSRFPVMENQPKELFHQTVSISGNEADNPAYTQALESVQTEVRSSSYRTPSPRAPRNPLTAFGIMGLGGGTIVSTARSMENFSTFVSQSWLVETEEESSYGRNGKVPPYPWPTTTITSSKEYAANNVEHIVLPSLGAPALASMKDQETHHGRSTAGAPSTPWAGIMGLLAASRQKEVTPSESSPAEPSVEVELFSQSLAHLGRKDYRWGAFGTHVPSGSVSMHVAEPEVEVTASPPAYAELQSQTSPGGDLSSLPIATNQVPPPTGKISPLRAQSPQTARLKVSWPQPSNSEGFGPGTFTVGWTPSVDVDGEVLEHPTNVASMATGERPSIGQKIRVSHGEGTGTGLPKETKMPGRTSMWRLFSTELFWSQRPFQPGHVVSETQRRPSSTLVIGRGITGAGNSELQARSPSRLGTTGTPRQCGGLQAGSLAGTISSHMERTTKRRASLGTLLKLGATNAASPGMEAKEHRSTLEGGTLPVRETRMPLSWASSSSNPRQGERMGHDTDLLEGLTASAVMSERRQAKPHKETPGTTEASDRVAAETTYVASSSSSTISVLSKPTPEGPQGSFSLRGTDSVVNTESPAAPSLELATGSKVSSKLKEMIPSAEGGPPEPENATEEMFLHWTNGATIPGQDETAWRSSAQSPSLEMRPTARPHVATGRTALLLSTGSLEPPKPVNYREGSTGSHSTKETLPLTGKVPAVGTTATLSAHQSNASSRESWENQSRVSIDTKEAPSAASQENGRTARETDSGPLASTEAHRIPSVGFSSLGSHDEHTAVADLPPVEPERQTEIEPMGRTPWPASETKAATVLSEERAKSLSTKSDVYVFGKSTAVATVTGVGFKRSGQKGTGMAEAASIGAELSSSQLPDSNSTTLHGEELTDTHGEKGAAYRSAGLTSELHSGASVLPHPGNGMTEVEPAVPGVQNSPDTEKVGTTVPLEMSSEGPYPVVTESPKEAVVITGTPGVHTQTLGSAESRIWSKNYKLHAARRPVKMYGHGGFPLSKGIPVGIENGELLLPSPESPGQTSETQTVMKVEGITRNPAQERKPERIRGFSVDNHDHLHVVKRSLLEIRATSASLAMSQPERRSPEGELPRSNTEHLNPSQRKTMKAFPKEHVLRTRMAALIGTICHPPAPGCFKVHCSNTADGRKNGAFPVENMAKAKQTGKALGVPTFKSRSLALLQRLPSALKKTESRHLVHERTLKATQSLAFCAFEMNLCGWEQSKTDDLDWMLEKEREQPAGPMEDAPCRTSGSHISLKPSRNVPRQKAVLISPVMQGIRCLKFWYSPTDSVMGEINFYIKLLNSSEWSKVWSMKGDRSPGWHQATVAVSKTCELQVKLEGVVGPRGRRQAKIDDLLLCRTPCWQCDNNLTYTTSKQNKL